MILDKIKQDSIKLRKERNPLGSFLSTLAAEAAMVGKNNGNRESTDSEVVKVLTKFSNNLNETINLLKQSNRDYSKELNELSLVESYLPKMMTEVELGAAINSIILELNVSQKKDMGKVMASLKSKYDGKYDNKVVSDIVKSLLS